MTRGALNAEVDAIKNETVQDFSAIYAATPSC